MVQDLLRKPAFWALPAVLCLAGAACGMDSPAPASNGIPDSPTLTWEQPYPAGVVFLSIERYDIALRYFQRAVKQNPRDARAWFQAGFCMGKLGQTEAKLTAYRKALQLDPKYVDAHYSLGISLLLAGRKCEANRELVALKPLDPESAGKLEQLIELMGDPDACAGDAPVGEKI